jgi:hypothetical protein
MGGQINEIEGEINQIEGAKEQPATGVRAAS